MPDDGLRVRCGRPRHVQGIQNNVKERFMKHYSSMLAGALLPGLAAFVAGCSQGSDANGTSDLDKITSARESNQLQEDLALATSRYNELLEKGSRTQTALDELRILHSQWNTDVMALLQNEDGRFLAADEADVKVFRAHVESMNPVSEETISNLSTSLNALIAPIKAAVTEGSVAGMPNPELVTRLTELDARIQESLTPYKTAVSAIQALAATAKGRGTRGMQTLQQEVDDLKSAEAAARAAKIEAARLEAEEEVTQQLAMAEQELVRAQGEKKRQELESQAHELRAQAEADAIKARATSSDTLKSLAPFVTKTKILFECYSPSNCRWIPGQSLAAPVSFGALTRLGALEPTQLGFEQLQSIATSYENDRPKWPSADTPEDWERVKENQKLLREFGTTLVELGHLAP